MPFSNTVCIPPATNDLGLPHQRHEQRRWPCLPQERMLQQLFGCCSLRGIPNQHSIQESLQSRGHLLGVLQLGRHHVPNPAHRLKRRFVEERRLSVHHLNDHNTQRPNVHLRPVRQARDYFGGHPVRRAHQRLALRQLLVDLCAEPKVGQLDATIGGQEYGIRLDVPMDDALEENCEELSDIRIKFTLYTHL